MTDICVFVHTVCVCAQRDGTSPFSLTTTLSDGQLVNFSTVTQILLLYISKRDINPNSANLNNPTSWTDLCKMNVNLKQLRVNSSS